MQLCKHARPLRPPYNILYYDLWALLISIRKKLRFTGLLKIIK